MEEELHILREYYITGARKNLAEEAFWNLMTTQHGGVPPVLPPGMRELSRLSSLEYKPNLDVEDGGDRNIVCWFFFKVSYISSRKATFILHCHFKFLIFPPPPSMSKFSLLIRLPACTLYTLQLQQADIHTGSVYDNFAFVLLSSAVRRGGGYFLWYQMLRIFRRI